MEIELASRLNELLGDRIAAQAARVDAELEKIAEQIREGRQDRLAMIPGLPAEIVGAS